MYDGIKNLAKRIKSRFTMQRKECAFIDTVDGKEVFVYIDCHGDRWLANYAFWFSTRVKIKSV